MRGSIESTELPLNKALVIQTLQQLPAVWGCDRLQWTAFGSCLRVPQDIQEVLHACSPKSHTLLSADIN